MCKFIYMTEMRSDATDLDLDGNQFTDTAAMVALAVPCETR